MYEELIKKLRNRRVCIQSGGSLTEDFPLMQDAADTIEELQAVSSHMEKREDASRCRDFIPKPQTNADRIRAMSDEELAEWMATKTSCMRCPVDLDACHNFEFSCEMSCEEILLSWLKSPVEEVDE